MLCLRQTSPYIVVSQDIKCMIIPTWPVNVSVSNKAVFQEGFGIFIFSKGSIRRVCNPKAECVQDFHEARMISYESTASTICFERARVSEPKRANSGAMASWIAELSYSRSSIERNQKVVRLPYIS